MTDIYWSFLAGALAGYTFAVFTFVLMLGLCYIAKRADEREFDDV
jgi:hypothetical protein